MSEFKLGRLYRVTAGSHVVLARYTGERNLAGQASPEFQTVKILEGDPFNLAQPLVVGPESAIEEWDEYRY